MAQECVEIALIDINYNRMPIQKRCQYCHKVYFVKPSRKITNKFCSKKCRILSTKGKPSWNKGLTKETNKSLKRTSEKHMGSNNPMWKGDNVGYGKLHVWIKSRKPKPQFCEVCKKNKPFDLANISGEYKRDINDFQWICRKCHMEKDGRLNNKDKKGRFKK